MPNRFNLKSQADTIALDVDNAVANSLTSLSQTAGIIWYPELAKLKVGTIWGDHFNRTSLSPTGFPTTWAESDAGAGTGNIISTAGAVYNLHGIALTTDTTATDFVQVNSSELVMKPGIESITTITAEIVMTIDQTTDTEIFIGLANTLFSAMPTTKRHMGFIFNRSVSANWRTSNADGTTQTVNTSSTAVDTSEHTLKIIWTDSTIDFQLDGTALNAQSTTNVPTEGLNVAFLILTEGAAAKTFRVDSVTIEAT